MIHRQFPALAAHILAPAEGAPGFNRHPLLAIMRQYLSPVLGALLIEQIPGRHTDDAHVFTVLRQFLRCIQREADFGTCSDENQVGLALTALPQRVGALLEI